MGRPSRKSLGTSSDVPHLRIPIAVDTNDTASVAPTHPLSPISGNSSNTRTSRSKSNRLSAMKAKQKTAATIIDDSEEEDCAPSSSPASRSTFAGVVVNNKPIDSGSSKGSRRFSHRSSVSSLSSIDSAPFSNGESTDDTPDTSTATTPAEPTRGMQKRKRAGQSRLRQTSTMDDEDLARRLQEEEYGNNEDLVDDQDEIWEVQASDDGDDLPLAKRAKKTTSAGTRKKPSIGTVKSSGPSSSGGTTPRGRPLRKARSSADKAMKTKEILAIDDSDGDDNYSIHTGDEEDFSDVPEDSDDGLEDMSDLSSLVDDDALPNLTGLELSGRRNIRKSRGQSATLSARARRRRSNPGTYSKKSIEVAERTMLDGRALKERIRLENMHPEIVTLWDDLAAIPKIEPEQALQPEGINRQLKSFQLEGLNWLRKQEKTRWKGGLLGDEMGMGKTIQAVSLIMSDYPQKQPTLVVVPPVALMQWSNEIKDYTDGKLKVLVYHGTNAAAKKMTVKELKQFDVIMISYNSVESIYRKETKGWSRQDNIVKEDSAIHAIHFHRLILDEAHSIKSRTTGVAKACFALKGSYKWCLSGTPVQNRIGEFFSLLRFLEVTPFANYYCKGCSCSALHWSTDAKFNCTYCGHRALDHVSVFNQEILNPITSSEYESIRKAAFGKLRLLTDRIMLRRMKRDHTASMELPPKEVIIHNEFFGEIERDFAGSIMNNTIRQFDTYVSRGVMLDNYANIFGLIMQMRQVADHPDLILRKHAEEGQNVMVCNICDEPCEDAIRSLKCKHDFCRSCVKEFIKTMEAAGQRPGCPRCHINLTIDLDQPEIEQDEESVKKTSIINRIKMENWTSSTKIEMLVYDLWKLRSKKQTTKSIVFSQFTSMLQLIEWRLRRAGFSTVMLDGSMTPQQRQKSIEHFMTNPDCEVFLVSLKAGGVALNLTEASRVFIVDPWWNPAAEWQSADRCHRIGQHRPCVITRLVVEDSIESRIVMLQEKKAQMVQSTINNDDTAMEKLTPADMQFLFRGS